MKKQATTQSALLDEDDEHSREGQRLAAEFVRAARQQAGLGQRQLGRMTGIAEATFWRLEDPNGRIDGPRIQTLVRVARACGKRLKLVLE